MHPHDLIVSHMPLAEKMARLHQGRGVEIDDLEGEAYMGLCEAAAEFDPGNGTVFATLARHKIRGRITTALGHANVVRFDVRSERAGMHVKRDVLPVEDMAKFYQFPDLDAEVNPCSIGPSETSSTTFQSGTMATY